MSVKVLSLTGHLKVKEVKGLYKTFEQAQYSRKPASMFCIQGKEAWHCRTSFFKYWPKEMAMQDGSYQEARPSLCVWYLYVRERFKGQENQMTFFFALGVYTCSNVLMAVFRFLTSRNIINQANFSTLDI